VELKKLIFILFLFGSVLQAQTVWYVDPAGSDDAGNGTLSSPWLTLYKATSDVTSYGDVIHLNAGDYYETEQSLLRVGVSIEGAGRELVTVNSTVTSTQGTIALASAQGTVGNQHISGITMDGGMVAHSAIWIAGRSEVSVYNCTFNNFFSRGVTFVGGLTDAEPTTYAINNKFYNNFMVNNADYSGSGKFGDGQGNLVIGGQDGILIYNNHIGQPLRAGTHNTGYCIKFDQGGFYRNMKIYNNTLWRPAYDGTWDFAMELWHSRGGIEIYNNDIRGGIDIAGGSWGGSICANDEAGAGYALKIYDNTIGFPTLQSVQQVGIYLERGITGGVYIYGNLIRNHWNAFQMYQGDSDTFEDVYIYSNIISGIGQVGSSGANTTEWGTIDGSNNITYDNINFVNNTIYAGSTAQVGNSGLRFTFKGTASNVTIRNNIIRGFAVYPIYIEGGTINTISIENNNYYDNKVSNTAVIAGATVTNKTEQNNIITDPLWVSLTDFHLQADSPNEGAGIIIAWIDYDYDGVPYLNPPVIGAYEKFTGATIPILTTTPITNITETTATSGGVVTFDGGEAVTARGVCWSTSTAPTTSDDKTSDGTGTGTFTSYVTGLTNGETYYLRAYATNSIGTAYGLEQVFTTPIPTSSGVRFIMHEGVFVIHNGKFIKSE